MTGREEEVTTQISSQASVPGMVMNMLTHEVSQWSPWTTMSTDDIVICS